MDIETIQDICMGFPHAGAEIKWRSDLVFVVGRRMFCMADLEAVPPVVSFKVTDEEYDELSVTPGFRPAPWFAKNKWVAVTGSSVLTLSGWRRYLRQSYDLAVLKLPVKVRRDLGL